MSEIRCGGSMGSHECGHCGEQLLPKRGCAYMLGWLFLVVMGTVVAIAAIVGLMLADAANERLDRLEHPPAASAPPPQENRP